MVSLVLNGTVVEDLTSPADMTLLDWLRESRHLTGTKEGCAEGDCGACTVAVGDTGEGWRAINACLTLLGQVDGRAVLTVEGLGTPSAPHPVQKTLAEAHGTQCGFCTPGIVMSMFAFQQGGEPAEESAIHEVLAGNLCRCTGYRPIVEALRNLPAAPAVSVAAVAPGDGGNVYAPRSLAALHQLKMSHPDAVLWAGGTDLGLLASKERRHFPAVISTAQVAELGGITVTDAHVEIGAAVTYTRAQRVLDEHFPAFGALLRRIGSRQIRNMGTLGGNLGTASPIGDTLPCLLALDATIILSSPDGVREVPVDSYFSGYRKTARREEEVIAAILIPRLRAGQRFVTYKVSKRFDQDISAVLGAFRLGVGGPRLAYGGMAAVPKRATALEGLVAGGTPATADIAAAIRTDFAPLTDHRASAGYRLTVAGNLLRRALAEEAGAMARLELL